MPIPPQFIKNKKKPVQDAEDLKDGGKDDANEDANGNIIKKPNPFAKKGSAKKKPGNAAEDAKDGGKDDAQETPTPASAKRAMLLAMAKKG